MGEEHIPLQLRNSFIPFPFVLVIFEISPQFGEIFLSVCSKGFVVFHSHASAFKKASPLLQLFWCSNGNFCDGPALLDGFGAVSFGGHSFQQL